MAHTPPQYPLLVDTDALIAVANSPLWTLLTEHLGLTTTNVCQQELKHHRRNTSADAPEGSRPYRLHHGSATALSALTEDQTPVTRVISVPRPHGADAGEESLRHIISQYPEAIDYVVLMDADGRRSLRSDIHDKSLDIRVVAPPFLFYILYDNDLISRTEFCEACADLLTAEGWTGYQAVNAAWEGIPVDCSDVIDTTLLP